MEVLLKEFCVYSGIKDCDSLVKKFLEKKINVINVIEPGSLMNTVTVFTDGACSYNGKIHAKAGIGLYFADTDDTYSENVKDILKVHFPTLKVTKVTNNIAELLAIYTALLILSDDHDLEEDDKFKIIIKTDSHYCINVFTKWYKSWEKNNWKTASGKPVVNKEIIMATLKLINSLFPDDVVFTYTPAHTEIPPKNSAKYYDWYGNFQADRLAVEGSK